MPSRVARAAALLLPLLPFAIGGGEAGRAGAWVRFAQGEREDARAARLVALHVPEGTAATPFLKPGPFTATFTGELEIDARDRFTFAFAGAGEFTLEIDGKPVLQAKSPLPTQVDGEPIRLRKGRNPFVARYTSPPSGDAALRVLWSSPAFGPEPLPPAKLWHAPEDGAAAARRAGRALALAHACARCHALAASASQARAEAARTGPDLLRAGARYTAAWLAEWLLDPHRFRPDTTMPRLLRGAGAEQDARDLVAWLAEQAAAAPAPAGEVPSDAPRAAPRSGAELVDTLRCGGCHRLPEQTGGADDLVPLAHVAAKWRAGALAAFLQRPDRDHEWARMPDFRLQPDEAAAIASFLQPRPPAAEPAPAGDAARGARRFVELGCAQCHPVGAQAATATTLPFGDPTRGCLADGEPARGRAPDFAFTPDEIGALRAWLAHGADSLATDCAVEDAERWIAGARCAGCHSLDGAPDRWTKEHPNAGARATLPALTWAGEKLNTSYLLKLLPGAPMPAARPWLAERMPGFAAPIASRLAIWLPAPHGLPRAIRRVATPDEQLATIGEKLIAGTSGFGCRQCHAIAGLAPNGVFDVQGVDLAQAATRLRPDWYRRWMRDPPRLDPGTKMPRYADANGRTGLVDVLDGDAERQFAAIWAQLEKLARR